jgi:hypothetical protein
MSNHPPRALSRREGDAVAPVYRLTGNKTKEETVLERPFKIGDARTDDRPRWLRPNDRNWLRFPDRCQSAGARTKEAVYEAIVEALHEVCPEDIAGWFRDRAAYAMQP